VFENQELAIEMSALKPSQINLNVKIEVKDFKINFLPTDAQNIAKLLRIITD
jgi:hypothetical protein